LQAAVEQLIALDPLPDSLAATEADLRARGAALERVATPLSDDEARGMLSLFGSDDCFGLAWTLLHLVETAPGWPLRDALEGDNQWLRRLRDGARRGPTSATSRD
jgi:hypothetical protein